MKLKKGGAVENILIQADLDFSDSDHIKIKEAGSIMKKINLYEAINYILIDGNNTNKIKIFLNNLSPTKEDIFNDIAFIVKNYDTFNFQSILLPDNNTIFGKYELFNKEDPRKFITIDPKIVQIMVFDDDIQNMNNEDIVYSLKLIIRENNKLTLRYTTQLFPNESKINNFDNLTKFNDFNLNLGNDIIKDNYNKELAIFLKTYIKFYNFYKKCYKIDVGTTEKPIVTEKNLIDYQLKYISILGKARFADPNIQTRTAILTDYIMSNLLFTSPTYAFISGGYKGFKDNRYGVTRSGYEIAKKYNRPILTIMCAEGKHDAHEYSDTTLIYGEHWGEDSIALSQLTDGAIIIAPFGGWTYIECLTLLANKKIVGIYNDLYNILNYEPTGIKFENLNFFKFTQTEQNNIINYYINYYLILLYLFNNVRITDGIDCLENGIKILSYLKSLLPKATKQYKTIIDLEIDIVSLLEGTELDEKKKKKEAEEKKFILDPNTKELFLIITIFNELKKKIDEKIKKYLDKINNNYYEQFIGSPDDNYQNNIPEKCDGIWIKPIFDLIEQCISIQPETPSDVLLKSSKTSQGKTSSKTSQGKTSSKTSRGKTGECGISGEEIINKIKKYIINIKKIDRTFLKKINTNIIFVFSDVMFLNIFLNTNLNKVSFQKKLHEKINKISDFKVKGANGSSIYLLNTDTQNNLLLDRSLDGSLNTDLKRLKYEHTIREKYSFIINNDCNNYTTLLKDKRIMFADIPKNIMRSQMRTELEKQRKKDTYIVEKPFQLRKIKSLTTRHRRKIEEYTPIEEKRKIKSLNAIHKSSL